MGKELKNARLKDGALMCIQRAGVILNNFSIALSAVIILVLLAALFSVLWGVVYVFLALFDMLFVLLATVFTVGIIWLSPDAISTIWFIDDITYLFDSGTIIGYLEMLMPYMPYVLGGVLVFAVASLAFLLVDKKNISVPRVAWSIFVIAVTVIGFIVVIIALLQSSQGGML